MHYDVMILVGIMMMMMILCKEKQSSDDCLDTLDADRKKNAFRLRNVINLQLFIENLPITVVVIESNNSVKIHATDVSFSCITIMPENTSQQKKRRFVLNKDDDRSLFKVDIVRGHGLGVVAKKDIKPLVKVGTYPGYVYTNEEHERLVESGEIKNSTYALDFFNVSVRLEKRRRRRISRLVEGRHTIDPSTKGGVDSKFSDALCLRLNEPSGVRKANCIWVINLVRRTLEVWTYSPIKKNEELTVCYGESYPRTYRTTCTWFSYARGYMLPGKRKPVQKPCYVPVIAGREILWEKMDSNRLEGCSDCCCAKPEVDPDPVSLLSDDEDRYHHETENRDKENIANFDINIELSGLSGSCDGEVIPKENKNGGIEEESPATAMLPCLAADSEFRFTLESVEQNT